ncbi:MAG: hypothetical protein LBH98_06580 [Chitinispirillales bacterium]|jgi:hypothetical protein|nr:hypothetical protein [Chitinispirillales bacterium]
MEILAKKNFLFIIIITFFCNSFSQEISVDLQDIKQKTNTKPNWAASGMNLILPGTGFFYLSEKKPATAFLTADILFWSGFFYTNVTSKNRYDDSKSYARMYAHTQSGRSSGDQYWAYLANKNFMKTQDFNNAIKNNRELDKLYTDENDYWSWDSEERRDEYAQIRKKAGYWKTASTLILGSLALNRLAAFVSARIVTNKYNDKVEISAPAVVGVIDTQSKTFGVSLLFGI